MTWLKPADDGFWPNVARGFVLGNAIGLAFLLVVGGAHLIHALAGS